MVRKSIQGYYENGQKINIMFWKEGLAKTIETELGEFSSSSAEWGEYIMLQKGQEVGGKCYFAICV